MTKLYTAIVLHDNNNNNLCLMWLRETAQPYNIKQYYTAVCHAGQQRHGTHTVTQDSNNNQV